MISSEIVNMEKKKIAKSILLSWIQLANKQGINLSSMDQYLEFSDENDMIPFEQFDIFVKSVLEKTGNTQFGMRLGEQSNLAALGIVGQLIQSSPTIKQSIEQASHFFNLISNVIHLGFQITSSDVILSFEVDEMTYKEFPETCQQLMITSLIFSFKEIYFLTLRRYVPLAVEMNFSTQHTTALGSIFNCPIKTGCKQNRLIFDKKILGDKIAYGDYELMAHLEKLACKRLALQNQDLNKFSNVVKSIVYTLIAYGFPQLNTVANQLNMSERSFQRKLKEENTSYSKLLEEIKRSFAKECLDKGLSVKETTYLLGYSEPSAFINAFIRWFGESPRSYKKAS